MYTQKVAITMPEMLIREVDALSKKQGLSRSRYIAIAVREKIDEEKKHFITQCYDDVFSDETIQKEQAETSRRFEDAGSEGGQEW